MAKHAMNTRQLDITENPWFQEAVDVVLAKWKVPRDQLFEYPYNEHESKKLVRQAEDTVKEVARLLG